MNSEKHDKLDKLFAAGRPAKTATGPVEYGFETRLLARIRAEREHWPWALAAWRLVPVFAAVVVALGVWSFASVNGDSADLQTAVTGRADESLLISSLTGE
jgi:hypothetical protein